MFSNEEHLSEYEAERAARIAANRARMAALGVLESASNLSAPAAPAPPPPGSAEALAAAAAQELAIRRRRERKRALELAPRRSSSRIAAGPRATYQEKDLFAGTFYSHLSNSEERGEGAPRVAASSCHSCRQKRDEMGELGEASSCWRCEGARGRFCRGCLVMRYGLSLEAIKAANERARREVEEREEKGGKEENEKEGGGGKGADVGEGDEGEGHRRSPFPSLPSPCGWLCPHCYEEVFGPSDGWICNSSLCLKRRPVPIKPTGVAVFECRARGHASVAHALQAQLTDGGRTSGGLVGPRPEGLGLVGTEEEKAAMLESVAAMTGAQARKAAKEKAAEAAAAAAAARDKEREEAKEDEGSPPSRPGSLSLPSRVPTEDDGENVAPAPQQKKRRGRPPKEKKAAATEAETVLQENAPAAANDVDAPGGGGAQEQNDAKGEAEAAEEEQGAEAAGAATAAVVAPLA